MIGKNYLKPLLFDEILTISLYGTEEDLEALEKCLDGGNGSAQSEVIELAKKVRERLRFGLRSECCPACKSYSNCIHKWLRSERGIRSTCCFRCHSYVKCAETIKKKQLMKVVRESKVRVKKQDNPPPPYLPYY